MVGPLPSNLSGLSARMRDRASDVRDRRVATLLSRWPHSLSEAEAHELRRLWEERLRLARFGGTSRLRAATEGRTRA